MKNQFSVLLIIGLALMSSCKKEGCTDSFAENFNTEAQVDDQSCIYEGNAIFWINASTSTNLENSLINELKVYIEGDYIGKMSTNSSLLTAPQCESGGGVSYFKNLESETSTVLNYEVKYLPPFAPPGNTDETVKYEGTIKIEGGKCQTFQLQ